jgi:hypothetical protein
MMGEVSKELADTDDAFVWVELNDFIENNWEIYEGRLVDPDPVVFRLNCVGLKLGFEREAVSSVAMAKKLLDRFELDFRQRYILGVSAVILQYTRIGGSLDGSNECGVAYQAYGELEIPCKPQDAR